MGRAAAWWWRINFSRSKTFLSENVVFDCLGKSCALTFVTGAVLQYFFIVQANYVIFLRYYGLQRGREGIGLFLDLAMKDV